MGLRFDFYKDLGPLERNMTMETLKTLLQVFSFIHINFVSQLTTQRAYISALPEFRRKVNMTLDIRSGVSFFCLILFAKAADAIQMKLYNIYVRSLQNVCCLKAIRLIIQSVTLKLKSIWAKFKSKKGKMLRILLWHQ